MLAFNIHCYVRFSSRYPKLLLIKVLLINVVFIVLSSYFIFLSVSFIYIILVFSRPFDLRWLILIERCHLILRVRRGNISLWTQGFIYRNEIIIENSGKNIWRCVENATEKKCHGRCHTIGQYVTHRSSHNHAADAAKVEARRATSMIKDRAVSSQDASTNVIAQGISLHFSGSRWSASLFTYHHKEYSKVSAERRPSTTKSGNPCGSSD